MNIPKTLAEFCGPDHSLRNHWIYERRRQTKAYLRKGKHMLGGQIRSCLDIASIDCAPQQKGHFKDFLSRAESLARENGFDAVFVEQVINKSLDAYLERRGYTPTPSDLVGVRGFWFPLLPSGDQSPP